MACLTRVESTGERGSPWYQPSRPGCCVRQVEAFFLEALDQVKQDIRTRNAATKRATLSLKSIASGSVRFPAIKESGSPTAGAVDEGRVELKDLSLEASARCFFSVVRESPALGTFVCVVCDGVSCVCV